jgi:hypothetical protein
MPNDARTQQVLAQDLHFRSRVRNALTTVAWQILDEAPDAVNHDSRAKYANLVLRNADAETSAVVPGFVNRPNVFQFDTSYLYDFDTAAGHVATAAGDADLMSQLATDWDDMAAAAGFPPVTA